MALRHQKVGCGGELRHTEDRTTDWWRCKKCGTSWSKRKRRAVDPPEGYERHLLDQIHAGFEELPPPAAYIMRAWAYAIPELDEAGINIGLAGKVAQIMAHQATMLENRQSQ
jgi:hypothetical protein